ncbi:MAG: O-antigen ligase family protein [Candidatus Eremiobacteraeota bacterium]|nr:O-antigen ligase family protein [Candidatus Eremiobacteraeota bacterium]MBV8366669.1 O-antigen ligase family protein [Candidatus Eremiobacteraeota bacterium]
MIRNVAAHVADARPGIPAALILGLATAALAGMAAFLLAGGSKTGTVLAIALAASPLLIYLSIQRPLIFPFGLYAVLVPFNHLIFLHGFGTLTKLAGILASAGLLFHIVRNKRIVSPPRVLLAWFVFVVLACASLLWAVDTTQSITLIVLLLQLFALFAVTALVPVSREELLVVLALIALGGIAAAGYGGKLFLTGTQTVGNRLFIESAVEGEYLDPNHFSAALLLPLALTLVYTVYAPWITRKAVGFAGLAVLMVGIYASGSRGGLVAAAAILLAVLVRTRRWLQLIGVTLAGLVLSLAVKSAVWSRFSADAMSGSGRSSIWYIGAHAFMQRPVLGWGIGNFADAYDRWLLQLYSPILMQWDRAAHNFIIMVAVELGVVGLAVLVWVMIEQARALRHIEPGSDLYRVRIALESALLGLLVMSFFLDTLYWKYAWLTFTAVALARSAALPSRQQAEAPQPRMVPAAAARR